MHHPQLALVADAAKPLFTDENVPGVSPTAQCVLILLGQYFILYTLIAVLRTFNQMTTRGQGLLTAMDTAAKAMHFAPMLSVLFLCGRIRAIQLSGGDPDKFNVPGDRYVLWMQIGTWCVFLNVIFTLITLIFTSEAELQMPKDNDGKIDFEKISAKVNKPMFWISTILKYGASILLYLSFAIVCTDIVLMDAPYNGPKLVSAAVTATMILSVQFFVIYFALAVTNTITQLKGPIVEKLTSVFENAAWTLSMAPMLCVLFIVARMRALQVNPSGEGPQLWAQRAFYFCAYAVLIQAILIVILPLVSNCRVEKNKHIEGDIKFIDDEGRRGSAIVLNVIRYVLLVSLYGGFTVILCSMFLIEAPEGRDTPPISSAVSCVVNLSIQYFVIYLLQFIAQSTRQLSDTLEGPATFVLKMMQAAKETVLFAPALAILFILTRMRALQLCKLDDGSLPLNAGPPRWAQDAMYLATWCLFLQLLVVIIMSCFFPSSGPVDAEEDAEAGTTMDGLKPPKDASYPWVVGILISFVRYVCLIGMWGSSIALVVSIFVMKPETLPPFGNAEHLIPYVPIPEPLTPPSFF